MSQKTEPVSGRADEAEAESQSDWKIVKRALMGAMGVQRGGAAGQGMSNEDRATFLMKIGFFVAFFMLLGLMMALA